MARLRHRFSPRRIRLGSSGNTALEGGEGDTTLCLVGRELCLFLTLDASKIPQKQRKAFATLTVRRTAPFADPNFDVFWRQDGSASIWYWSAARVGALASTEPGRKKRYVAEAIYAGWPRNEGVELLQLDGCVEGRIWKAGQLLASRHWPETPTLAQWQMFLRGCGLAAQEMPAVVSAPLGRSPWHRQPTEVGALQISGFDQYLPKAALVLGALVLLITGAEIGSAARAQADIWRAHAAATRLDAPLKRILDARDATDRASEEITQLLALRNAHPTTSLLAELTRLMPEEGVQIKQWNQPTPDTVDVSLIAPKSNPEQLVSAWENSPMFEKVSTELGRDNELVIKATLTPVTAAPQKTSP